MAMLGRISEFPKVRGDRNSQLILPVSFFGQLEKHSRDIDDGLCLYLLLLSIVVRAGGYYPSRLGSRLATGKTLSSLVPWAKQLGRGSKVGG